MTQIHRAHQRKNPHTTKPPSALGPARPTEGWAGQVREPRSSLNHHKVWLKRPWWQPAANHPRKISSFTKSCKLQFASFSLEKQHFPKFGTEDMAQNQPTGQLAHPGTTFTSVSSECPSSGNFPATPSPECPMRPKIQEASLTALSHCP